MPSGVHHEARVFKAGNSLAIRIPAALAKHFDLEDGSTLEIGADNDMLYVRKAGMTQLDDLIEKITPENVHPSYFDTLIGRERW